MKNIIIAYGDLDKHFTYSEKKRKEIKIPRKLKKKIKQYCKPQYILYNDKKLYRYTDYQNLSVGQRLWYYLEESNPNYKTFRIKKLIEKDNASRIIKPFGLYDNLIEGGYKGYGLKYLLSNFNGFIYLQHELKENKLLVDDEVNSLLLMSFEDVVNYLEIKKFKLS